MGAGKAGRNMAKGERVVLHFRTKQGILLLGAALAAFQQKPWYFSAWDDVGRLSSMYR